MAEAEHDIEPDSSQRPRRSVPRVALLGPALEPDLLSEFPGRFVVRRCQEIRALDSLLLSSSLDLVVIDCRESVPDAAILELVRQEGLVDYLAVGQPENRRSLPSFMRSHWCPWPVDLRSFYRLVVALARKAAWERAFRRQRRQMAELTIEAQLGRQLAQVLHELNNPLDAVMRFMRLALDRQIDPAASRWLENAELGLMRMAQTLQELHRDGRQAAQQLGLIDLRDVLREAAITSGVVDSEMDLEVLVHDEQVVLPQALTSVLTNLLKNARDACRGKGKIAIETRLIEDRLEIAVRDDGEGFGELFKEELFRPWSKTKGSSRGLGLGLHAARIAVEQLGGKIDAESAGIGQGATFLVRIPVFERRLETLGEESGS